MKGSRVLSIFFYLLLGWRIGWPRAYPLFAPTNIHKDGVWVTRNR